MDGLVGFAMPTGSFSERPGAGASTGLSLEACATWSLDRTAHYEIGPFVTHERLGLDAGTVDDIEVTGRWTVTGIGAVVRSTMPRPVGGTIYVELGLGIGWVSNRLRFDGHPDVASATSSIEPGLLTTLACGWRLHPGVLELQVSRVAISGHEQTLRYSGEVEHRGVPMDAWWMGIRIGTSLTP